MIAYDFYDLSGQWLTTIATDDPDRFIGEISHATGVDVDEIDWEESDAADN